MAATTKIDWADATINGWWGCSWGCSYCYARSLKARFAGKYPDHPDVPGFRRLELFPAIKALATSPRPKDGRVRRVVFLESMGDPFDPAVPDAWKSELLAVPWTSTTDVFVALTKQPQRIAGFRDKIPPNLWLGVSLEGGDGDSIRRLEAFSDTWGVPGRRRVLCIEPFTTPMDEHSPVLKGIGDFNWVIVGGLSGRRRQPAPRGLTSLVVRAALAQGVPVYVKRNAGLEPAPRLFPYDFYWPYWTPVGDARLRPGHNHEGGSK